MATLLTLFLFALDGMQIFSDKLVKQIIEVSPSADSVRTDINFRVYIPPQSNGMFFFSFCNQKEIKD